METTEKIKVYCPAYQTEIEVEDMHDYYYYKVFTGFNYDHAEAYAQSHIQF